MKGFEMMKKSIALALNIAVFVVCLQSCKQEEPAALGLSAMVSPREGQQGPATSSLPDRFNRVLVGKIDNKYPIQMELSRNKDRIFGRYFYENRRDGKYLNLSGSIDASGTVKITESDGEKETGSFTGKLLSDVVGSETYIKFVGSWTGAKDAKTLPVELSEKRFDLGGGLRILEKERKDEEKITQASIETKFAQISGSGDPRIAAFNQAMSNFVEQEIKSFKEHFKPDDKNDRRAAGQDRPENALDISYRVLHADNNLVSIIYTTYTYTGGAHGNAGSTSFNYDLKRGRMLELADLFQPNSNYIKLIADYSMTSIRKRNISDDNWIREGAGANKKNYASWNIVPEGLLITFDAYQVASYAAGPQEVIIPFSALKGIIKLDGPLSALVKKL
jgi:hypothetical protein